MENLKAKIRELLGKEIIQFELKGKGACNNAYFVETTDGKKYIVKEEREAKEFQAQNSLLVETAVAQKLSQLNLSISTPKVVFVSKQPQMYGYEYVEGNTLKNIWQLLTEEEKVDMCKQLGKFHAELGKKINKKEAEDLGVKINDSKDVHPESLRDYEKFIADESVPLHFRELAQKARELFLKTFNDTVFQFLHNDAHHENVLIKDKKIVGYIDFGESEYGEAAKEFSRYIRDFPNHFEYIVEAYESESQNKISRVRLLTYSLLSGFADIVEDYRKGGEDQVKAEKSIEIYTKLLASI